jgi:hypothetical protein
MDELEIQGWERELQAWKRRLDGMEAPSALRAELNALASEIANVRARPGIPPEVTRARVEHRLARLRALDAYLHDGGDLRT